jgi:hypothetical protein
MTTITNCRFCGMSHGIRCPSVKAIEYFEDGVTVKRVEFMTASDYYQPAPYNPVNSGWPNTAGSYGPTTGPMGPRGPDGTRLY